MDSFVRVEMDAEGHSETRYPDTPKHTHNDIPPTPRHTQTYLGPERLEDVPCCEQLEDVPRCELLEDVLQCHGNASWRCQAPRKGGYTEGFAEVFAEGFANAFAEALVGGVAEDFRVITSVSSRKYRESPNHHGGG